MKLESKESTTHKYLWETEHEDLLERMERAKNPKQTLTLKGLLKNLLGYIAAFFFMGMLFSQPADGEIPIHNYRAGFTAAAVLVGVYLIYRFGHKMGEYSKDKQNE